MTLHKYMYANMSLVMYVDPSGNISIIDVMAVTTTMSMVLSISYSTSGHLISYILNKQPVEWNGKATVFTAGEGWGSGLLIADITSECRNQSKANGKYLLYFMGATVGWLPANLSHADITLTGPGIIGLEPKLLSGPAIWMSGSAVVGKGLSYSVLYMGMGIGNISPYFEDNAAYGVDVGVDIMSGISILLNSNTSHCNSM